MYIYSIFIRVNNNSSNNNNITTATNNSSNNINTATNNNNGQMFSLLADSEMHVNRARNRIQTRRVIY